MVPLFNPLVNLLFSRCEILREILFEEPCQITKLDNYCFSNCNNLTKIDLPVSIQKIDYSAFSNTFSTPLKRVILRGLFSIENRCFPTNALTYVHISDSIQELDENSFYLIKCAPQLNIPCKIYIRPEFHDEIKRMFEGRDVEFIGNDLEEGYVLK